MYLTQAHSGLQIKPKLANSEYVHYYIHNFVACSFVGKFKHFIIFHQPWHKRNLLCKQHMYIYTYICTYLHIHVYLHIYVYVYIDIYIYTPYDLCNIPFSKKSPVHLQQKKNKTPFSWELPSHVSTNLWSKTTSWQFIAHVTWASMGKVFQNNSPKPELIKGILGDTSDLITKSQAIWEGFPNLVVVMWPDSLDLAWIIYFDTQKGMGFPVLL